MGLYCRALRHFVIAMAIIEEALLFKAKWSDGLERTVHLIP